MSDSVVLHICCTRTDDRHKIFYSFELQLQRDGCNSRRLHLQPVCDLSQTVFFIGLTSFYNLRQLFENPKNLCFLLIFDPYLLILVSALEYLTPPEWVPSLSKDPRLNFQSWCLGTSLLYWYRDFLRVITGGRIMAKLLKRTKSGGFEKWLGKIFRARTSYFGCPQKSANQKRKSDGRTSRLYGTAIKCFAGSGW